MANSYADLVQETTTTTGTGTYSLAGAATGFQSFISGVGSGSTVTYTCTDGTNWEVGNGVVTSGSPNTLTRATILASSNSGAAVSWASGTKNISLTVDASWFTAPTVNTVNINAGTTTVAPLSLTPGSLLSSPYAGAGEYDGICFYDTPSSACRGVRVNQQYCVQQVTHTLTSQTAAQKLFNTSTNGALTLPTGTFEFSCAFSLSSMSTSSGTFGFAFGGTATVTQRWWAQACVGTVTTATANQGTYNVAANTSLSTSGTSGTGYCTIEGVLIVTAAGTIIPEVSLTHAAAAVVGIGSYFFISPLGSSSNNSVGNWS